MDDILEKRIRAFLLPKITPHFIRFKSKWNACITFNHHDYYEEGDTELAAKEKVMIRLLDVKDIETLYLTAKK